MGSSPPGRGPGRDKADSADAGFDRWIGNRLHSLFDPVLNEPVPDAIAQLIAQFKLRDDPADAGAAESDNPISESDSTPTAAADAVAPATAVDMAEAGDETAGEPDIDGPLAMAASADEDEITADDTGTGVVGDPPPAEMQG